MDESIEPVQANFRDIQHIPEPLVLYLYFMILRCHTWFWQVGWALWIMYFESYEDSRSFSFFASLSDEIVLGGLLVVHGVAVGLYARPEVGRLRRAVFLFGLVPAMMAAGFAMGNLSSTGVWTYGYFAVLTLLISFHLAMISAGKETHKGAT